MELQFQKQSIPCLWPLIEERCDQTLSQEHRLADGQPDAQKVISVWGQPQIRSKAWQRDSVQVSGGVQLWILYRTDQGELASAEDWLPFEMEWDLPEKSDDGVLWVTPLLIQAEGRCLSERKLSLRCTVQVMMKAFSNAQTLSWEKMDLPEDVELLSGEQTAMLLTEAGECAFSLEEELTEQPGMPKPEYIVYACLQPKINEQKIMGGKLVFRGVAAVHLVYGAQGRIYTLDQELPVGQFAGLEQVHEADAQGNVQIILTGFDLRLQENGIYIKTEMVGQYFVFEPRVLHSVVDGYSTERQWKVQTQQSGRWQVDPGETATIKVKCPWDEIGELTDVAFYPGQPQNGQIQGSFQVLYYDDQDQLCSKQYEWEHYMEHKGWIQSLSGAESMEISTMQMEFAEEPVVTGMELTDAIKKPENGPSLILRRAGQESLWELAKKYGSTIRAIQKVNGLSGAPDSNEMLLILM